MSVVYAIPQEGVIRISRSITLRNLGLLLLTALMSLIVTHWLAQILFGKRLNRIVETTRKIKEGNLKARIGFERDTSDLGRIAGALDSMAEALQKRDKELLLETERLNNALADNKVLLKEVHHRVKNNLQLILSLIRLQSDSGREDKGSWGEIESKITAIALVHEMLYQTEQFSSVDLGSYCENLVSLIKSYFDNGRGINVKTDTQEIRLSLNAAVPFGLLLNELTVNAYKHAFSGGKGDSLWVNLRMEKGIVCLTVKDNGPGLKPGFSLTSSSGTGLRIASALAVQISGRLVCASVSGGSGSAGAAADNSSFDSAAAGSSPAGSSPGGSPHGALFIVEFPL